VPVVEDETGVGDGAGRFVPIAVGVGATFVALDTGVFVEAETFVAVAARVG